MPTSQSHGGSSSVEVPSPRCVRLTTKISHHGNKAEAAGLEGPHESGALENAEGWRRPQSLLSEVCLRWWGANVEWGVLGDPGLIFLAPQIDRKPRRFSGGQERKKQAEGAQ